MLFQKYWTYSSHFQHNNLSYPIQIKFEINIKMKMNLLRVYTSLILSLLIEDFSSRPGMS